MTLINVHFLTRRKTPMDSHNTLPIKKLLVAEDNESNFLLVMAILKKEYQIIHAVDGVETLQ